MKKALLIIDVQQGTAAAHPQIIQKIQDLQSKYDHVFASRFENIDSPIIRITGWEGLSDTSMAFKPLPHVRVFQKNIFSSYISDLNEFDEVHICGFDTDACVLKTAYDLIEHGIKPVILSSLCASENATYHTEALHILCRNIGEDNVK